MTNKMEVGTVRRAVGGIYMRHLYAITSKALVLKHLNAGQHKFGVDNTTNEFWD